MFPVRQALAIWWQVTTDLPVSMLVLEELEDRPICKWMRTAFSAAPYWGACEFCNSSPEVQKLPQR